MKKSISAIIFWGAVWGLEEATLGHLLHVISFNVGWFIWFPLAYFFMGMVYRQTGRLNSILLTASISASIKFIDLFMTTNLVIVICPALSILLEGISLYAVVNLVNRNIIFKKYRIAELLSVNLLWRIMFMAGLLLIPSWIMASYPYKSISAISKFLFYQGIVNSLFIFVITVLVKTITKINERKNTYFKSFSEKIFKSRLIKDLCFKPLFSIGLLAVAVIIQWVL